MKKHIILFIISIFFTSLNIQSQNVILSSGTNIELYAANKISSKNLDEGDDLHFYVKNNIIDDAGRIIIAANTYVKGTVDNLVKARSGGKQGSMDIIVKGVPAVDGQLVPVFLDLNNQGEDRSKVNTNVGMLLFWPALLAKGGEATIKVGAPIIVKTVQNISFKINNLKTKNSSKSNTIYNDLIQQQVEKCGDKPIPPKRLSHHKSNYAYKTTKEYGEYERKLKKWEDCMPYLPVQESK